MSLTDAVIRQIEASLEQMAAEQVAFDAAIDRIEADGFRIVNGGQVSDEKWEYTDWRTGEVLAAGTQEDGDVDLPDTWWHVDNVTNKIYTESKLVPGLPEWLANAIIEAVDNNAANMRAWMDELRRDEVTTN